MGNDPSELNADEDVAQQVQDDRRETQMRLLLGLLEAGQGRYGADAMDEIGNEFELKSTTRTSVSTARDVGIHTIEKWRHRYWVFAKGPNLEKAGFVIQELYILDPQRLEGWFSLLETEIQSDLNLLERVLGHLKDASLTETEVERLRYLVARGATRNNPHIPWQYVESHGVRVQLDEAPKQRRAFVQQNRLSK